MPDSVTDMADASALLGRYTQDTRLLRLTTLPGVDLVPERVIGEEAISEGYSFRIEALSLDAHLSLKSLLGQPALLELLTGAGRYAPARPFHGYITAMELNGANGGFARYVLTLAPWTAFLKFGRDSRVFQDMDVFEILDTVFRGVEGRGRLAPAWRFEIADPGMYPRRSLTTQYQESDLAFAERLMHEEGLFYFFEHAGDGGPSLGSHTMVIADHNGAFRPNPQRAIRFTQPGAVMREDSIDRWRTDLRASSNGADVASWDYRALQQRRIHAADASNSDPMVSRDVPGAYAYPSREQGQRIADNQLQAMAVARQRMLGAGTVRTLSPGTTFSLHGHARYDRFRSEADKTFAVLRVTHLMHNNLEADLLDVVGKFLGHGPLAPAHGECVPSQAAGAISERPVYRNRIEAIPWLLPFRSSGKDGAGRLLHPRPLVRGQQTAVVVGPPGALVHTDRDHRIKIQFHWQRGRASHSRLAHPSAEGHTGAPGDDTAGTWVRVATPIAGANWGSNMLPRVGQEVLVDFFEGDIDRPVVVACLYGGRGQADAAYNKVCNGAGPVTGNAPPWFAGENGAHAHPATLSGVKSQAMQSSQEGTGAYGQLVLDDSPGQARLSLQSHGRAHDGASELNLGYLRHQRDNERLHPVGLGAELKSAHATALRTGQGMLLSSGGGGGQGEQLDVRDALQWIGDAHELGIGLAERARRHNAGLKDEPEPASLLALSELKQSAEVLRHTTPAREDAAGGAATAFGAPQFQLQSSAGIVATTPSNAVLAAGTTGSMSAGQDIGLVAQGTACTSAAAGISLFSYGKATSKEKPNQETGIKFHAASGKWSSQSQSDATRLTADKAVTVASVGKSLTITAPKKHVLLTVQGASIKLEGGNIMLHAPGKVDFKASMKELAGPMSVPGPDIANKVHELKLKRDLEIEYVDADGNLLTDEPIGSGFSNGEKQNVTLDSGGTAVVRNAPLGPFKAEQSTRQREGDA